MRPEISTVLSLKGRIRGRKVSGSHSSEDGQCESDPPEQDLGSMEQLAIGSQDSRTHEICKRVAGAVVGRGTSERRSLTCFFGINFLFHLLCTAQE